jgi:hypothetical protein
MSSPELWIPAGSWAEWVGALLAGGSLVGLVIGLRQERSARVQDEEDRARERRSEQAKLGTSEARGCLGPASRRQRGPAKIGQPLRPCL